MRVLAFRHVPFEPLGRIADVLTGRGIEFEYVDLYAQPRRAVSIGDADALIFMGGPMSVNDDLPYIRQELDCIAQAIALGKPILGVCLGSQLIAKALGARVYRNRVKEIGWAPVYWTEAARQDPLFSDLDSPESIFHWHGETFDLPPGAELLAYSDACRHQAYHVGDNVYGLQFHLEATPETIAGWLLEDANCGDIQEVTEPIDPGRNADRMAWLSGLIFGRWCALLDKPRAQN